MSNRVRRDGSDAQPPNLKTTSKYSHVRLSDESIVEELRAHFIREIERTAPEVLQKLLDRVLPTYREACHAIDPPGVAFLRHKWPKPLRLAVMSWAKEVRLLHKGQLPAWVLSQIECTLWVWFQHPEWFVKRLGWGFLGGQSGYSAEHMAVPPGTFQITLPQHEWHWEGESLSSWKSEIMSEISDFVDTRLFKIQQVLEGLPKGPKKHNSKHFTWTVLHQVRGVTFEDLAKEYKATLAEVKNPVMALKKRIGISLPKGRRAAK